MKKYRRCLTCQSSLPIQIFRKDELSKDGYRNDCNMHRYSYYINIFQDPNISDDFIKDIDCKKIAKDIFDLSRPDNDIKKTHDNYIIPFDYWELIEEQKKLMSELNKI